MESKRGNPSKNDVEYFSIHEYVGKNGEKTRKLMQWLKSKKPKDYIIEKNKPVYVVRRRIREIDQVLPALNTESSQFLELSREKELLKEELRKLYSLPKINYSAFQRNTGIGVTELWGARPEQEDRVVYGALPSKKITVEQLQRALRRTIEKLQKKLEGKNWALTQGSTLCTSFVLGNKIITASVGDSVSFLSEKNSNEVKLLNNLHTGSVATANTNPIDHGINLGRSLGDNALVGSRTKEGNLFSHEPDIRIQEIPKEGPSFLIVACDGLTEKMNKETGMKDMQDVIKSHTTDSPVEISHALAQWAYDSKSGDNISVIVLPLDPIVPAHFNPKDEEIQQIQEYSEDEIKYMAVFDGHGGDEVSEFLEQNFESILKHEIALELNHDLAAQENQAALDAIKNFILNIENLKLMQSQVAYNPTIFGKKIYLGNSGEFVTVNGQEYNIPKHVYAILKILDDKQFYDNEAKGDKVKLKQNNVWALREIKKLLGSVDNKKSRISKLAKKFGGHLPEHVDNIKNLNEKLYLTLHNALSDLGDLNIEKLQADLSGITQKPQEGDVPHLDHH